MIRIQGRGTTVCDGFTRRDLLCAGTLSLLGGLASSTAAEPVASNVRPKKGRAKSVILIDLFGGPSHLDTFDPKPAAPAEVRGEFKTIATSLPGLQVCEHLPQLVRRMHEVTLIRSVSHRYNSHNPYAVMTGFTGGNDAQDYYSRPTDHPSMGSVCHYLGLGKKGVPPYVCLPALPGYSQGLRRCGPYGGYLGSQYNPLFATCEPKLPRDYNMNKDFYDPTMIPMGDPQLPSMQAELTADILDRRKTLLEQLDTSAARMEESKAVELMSHRQREAFGLLRSSVVRSAFDLGKEAPAVRDRYGRDVFGSSVLLARRLVEAGVTFVTIHTEAKGAGHWDTHANNFAMLRGFLLPFLDAAVSSLLDELKQRGLLDSTLVLVMGDMGRTPKVNKNAGRDHWPQCGFCLLFGGGTKSGYVHGCSDSQGGYVKDHPVSPGDLVATVYDLLGIDSEVMVPDHTGRPIAAAHGGSPVRAVYASA